MMSKHILLGLDIGTTNVKVAAFNPDGDLLVETSVAYPTYYPHPGWSEQDPKDWEAAAMEALSQLVTRLGKNKGDISALGLCAHAPGLIPVDASGHSLLERIPIWQDERSFEHGRRLLKEIGAEWVGLGMPFAAFGAKLRWFTDTHPDLAQTAARAVGVKAFLLHWLTGEYATDRSSEPGRSKNWERMCSACAWSIDKLVPVCEESEVIANLREDLAQQLGLKHPVPVINGLNDGASATLGNGAARVGDAVITLGTNGVIFLVTDQPVAPEVRLQDAIFYWPYLEGRWIVGGQTKSGAASLQWYLGWEQSGPLRDSDYTRILDESTDAPLGSRGVTFLPYLMGKGTPGDDPSATGAFLGLSLQTVRGDLTRAVLEGVAFTLRDAMNALSRHGASVEKMMITGGGARSELWRQIVADVLNQPIHHSIGDSCLGAAMLAAVGIGLHEDVDAAVEKMKPQTTEVDPLPQNVEIYEVLYQEFRRRRDIVFEL